MSEEPWRDVEAIFNEALTLDPTQRAALLDVRCSGRPELRSDVESLLASHDDADAFLQIGTTTESRSPVALMDHDTGLIVGRFRLRDKIATGGMGVVYRAERADGEFSEHVAVKLLTASIRSADGLRRFRVERQILATLNHPDIVTLLDGGVTDTGQAYLAMTYVDGVSIVEHCTRRRLTLVERIHVFQRVCAAVQYAHQNGVVHRDLKPANILVTADGLPKVLDFGVAKLLDASGAGGSDVTTTTLPLTPNYASPEQLRGLPVTTASDIYALGVILYELLTGTRPYDTSSKPLDEVMRVVLDTEVVRPSRAMPADDRRPPYSFRALAGDLDAIVSRALRKTPDERYRSAAALADDLSRYLTGRPVETREPSLGYVARKLAARHKAAFATAAVSMVVILTLLGVSLWQAQVARDERDRARVEAARAREVSDFLSNLFQSANPVQARGQTLTARDVLDRGTEAITTRLAGQPEVQASLLIVMSEAYERIGVMPTALELAQRSATLREDSLGGSDSVELAASLHVVGRTLRRLGRPKEAVIALERALKLRESRLSPNDRSVALTLRELALARTDVGLDGAREMFERAIRIEEQATPASATLGLLYNNLAGTLYEHGDMEGAKGAWERSLAVYGAVEDNGGFAIALPLVNLGILMTEREEFATAEPLLKRALVVDDKWLGPDNAGQAFVYAYLGELARAQGDYAQAHRWLDESFRVYAKTRPPDHFELAPPLIFLGKTLAAEGKPHLAFAPLERALRIREQTNGLAHASLAEPLVPLARVHAQTQSLDSALPIARRALDIQRRTRPAGHPGLIATLNTLGETLLRQRNRANAAPFIEEAAQIARQHLPERHSERLMAEALLRESQ